MHWLSITNSIMIVLCLAGLIAQIMSKALKRDITQFEIMKQKQIEKLKILKKKVKKQIYSTIGQTEEHTQADEEAKAEGDEQQAKPEEDFVLDEIAWKKVKGEVFKRPKCSLLFSIMIGPLFQSL